MLSAGGALLGAAASLREGERFRAAIQLPGGPCLELSGRVVGIEEGKPLVQWIYEGPEEADNVDAALRKQYGTAAGITAGRQRRGWKQVSRLSCAPRARVKGRGGETGAEASRGILQLTEDKKIDLRATLRNKAKVVRAAELAARHETVQVFDFATIKELIKEAVAEAVAYLGPSLREAERQRILEEAEANFREKARLHEAEKAGLERRIQVLQEEIARSRASIEEEKARVLSSYQFTVSQSGMLELEDKLGRILERALRAGKAGKALEEELRQIVSRLLDDEREKIREQAEKAQSDRIALLEKKVGRLASMLKAAEEERDEAARRAEILEKTGGIFFGNLYKAGIEEGDPNRERKLLLMKEIFEFNKRVRKELEEFGVVLARRENGEVSKPEPAPEGTGKALPDETEATPASDIAPPAAAELPEEETGPDDEIWEPPEDFAERFSQWSAVRNPG